MVKSKLVSLVCRASAVAIAIALGSSVSNAERRCVTVTTGPKAVTYAARSYVCANPDGTGIENHDVSAQLGPLGWTIPANSVRTKYFDVPCSDGKHVVGFSSIFLWPNATCGTTNGRTRLPPGQPLGTVRSNLACAKDPGLGPDGGCSIFTCPVGDGPLVVACFTPIDPETCACGDPSPPVEGLDYEIGGEETETLAPPITSFCDASDGALGLCPCGNPGAPTSGCDIAQATGGVEATVTAQDTLGLTATIVGTGHAPAAFPTALVIRANNLEPIPVAFGDGLRCVGLVGFVRLTATVASGGTSTHVIGHGAGPGTFHYQIWFRNTPISFCVTTGPASGAFNLSNGQSMVW